MVKKNIVTAKMSIMEIISKHPESGEIMMKSGMHCIGCSAAAFETLGDGAAAHGMTKAQINTMLKKINSAISKKK